MQTPQSWMQIDIKDLTTVKLLASQHVAPPDCVSLTLLFATKTVVIASNVCAMSCTFTGPQQLILKHIFSHCDPLQRA